MSGIGVAEWCLPRHDERALDQLAALGLDAVHVDFRHFDGGCLGSDDARRSYFGAADAAGVTVAALALNEIETIGMVDEHDGSLLRGPIDMVRRAIDAAARWSVPLVYVPSFGRAAIGNEAAFIGAAAFFALACAHAEGSDVEVATENVLPPRDAARLLGEVADPRFAFMADLYNPALHGQVVVDVLRAVLPRLSSQIHVKDGRDGALGDAPVGDGDAAFDRSATFLVAHDFRCVAILENDYLDEAAARIRRDMAAVRRHMGSILESVRRPQARAA